MITIGSGAEEDAGTLTRYLRERMDRSQAAESLSTGAGVSPPFDFQGPSGNLNILLQLPTMPISYLARSLSNGSLTWRCLLVNNLEFNLWG